MRIDVGGSVHPYVGLFVLLRYVFQFGRQREGVKKNKAFQIDEHFGQHILISITKVNISATLCIFLIKIKTFEWIDRDSF